MTIRPGEHGAAIATGGVVLVALLFAIPAFVASPSSVLLVAPAVLVAGVVWYRYFTRRQRILMVGPTSVSYRSEPTLVASQRGVDRELSRCSVKRVLFARDLVGISAIAIDSGEDHPLFGIFGVPLTKQQLLEIASTVSEELGVPCDEISVSELRAWPRA